MEANKLYLKNLEAIEKVARRVSSDEEFQQVARIRMLKALESYDGNKASLKSYLGRVAINSVRTRWKKDSYIQHQKIKFGNMYAFGPVTPEENVFEKELIERTRYFLSTSGLKKRDQDIVSTIMSPDFDTMIGVSRKLGISEMAVYRSLKRLRKAFEKSMKQWRKQHAKKIQYPAMSRVLGSLHNL